MSDNNDSMKIHSNTSISMWNTLFVFRSTFILLFILLGMLTKSHAFQTIVTLQIYKQKISSTTSISARFIESGVDELMKFGNTMNIKLKLPCRDQGAYFKSYNISLLWFLSQSYLTITVSIMHRYIHTHI